MQAGIDPLKMGTSGRDEIDVAMAAFMFAEDLEAAPSGEKSCSS